jgi:mono/diheme cytochrome c family protein
MHSNSVHPLARLMGAAIPLVALALLACPEKKEEGTTTITTTTPIVDAGAPPAAVAEPPVAAAPEVDAGAAEAPTVDAGAPTGTKTGKGSTTGTKTGTPTTPTTPTTEGTATGTTTGTTPGTTAGTTGAAAAAPTKAVTEPDKKTQRTWKAKCASCHGGDGKGDTDQGKKMKVEDMTTAAFQSHVTDAQIRKAIADGYKATVGGVTQEMPGYGSELAPDQIDALVNYIRWLGKK